MTQIIAPIYRRDLTRANEIQSEIQLIFTVMKSAGLVACEVFRHFEIKGQIHSTISFKITKDFLCHLLEKTARNPNTFGIGLKQENIDKVRSFFKKADLSLSCFEKLAQMKSYGQIYSAAASQATPLQTAYRQTDDWFKKINLNTAYHEISCFDYVILKVGFTWKEFFNYLCRICINRDISFDDYVSFLNSKNIKPAALPRQPGDLIVHYSEDSSEILHAELVAEDTKLVYAKFGAVPFAYLHNADETPIQYGIKYRIFRKFS